MKIKSTIKKASTVLVTIGMLFTTTFNAYATDKIDFLNNSDWNNFIEEKIEQDSITGLSLVVVNDSETGYKNWGYADKKNNEQITEDSVLGIGSCSKAFTALTIFLLQEEGKLSIEDSVSDYIPWWNVKWNGIEQDTKIWQLLNHCSGIPDSTMMKMPTGTDDSLFEETVRLAENCNLTYEPCTAFEYCNLGYDILAYITETVSGMNFEKYVEQEIFQPLGMIHSGYDIPTVQGYRWFYGSVKEYNEPPFRGCYGDGQLRSTAKDMSCWINAQLGNIELPEKLENAINASHEMSDKYKSVMYEDDNVKMEYSGGWVCYNDYIYHSGTNPSFSSYILIDRNNNIGIFAFSNAWVNTADYAVNSLYQVMKGEEINREQLNVIDTLSLADTIAIYITIISIVLFLIALVLFFTQKKRLANKNISYKKEKKKFFVRSAVLLPLTVFIWFFIDIVLCIAGYGFASYEVIGIWLPYSVPISFVFASVSIFFMWLSSLARFLRCKKTAS